MLNTDELPEYQSHKKVWALKIVAIAYPDDLVKQMPAAGLPAHLIFDSPYPSIRVAGDYLNKHNPQVGGYFVVYEDGYESFSPAKAFESGYTKTK